MRKHETDLPCGRKATKRRERVVILEKTQGGGVMEKRVQRKVSDIPDIDRSE